MSVRYCKGLLPEESASRYLLICVVGIYIMNGLRRSQGRTDTNAPRYAVDRACSTGGFSRWWIVTLIELIALIFLIGPSLRFGLHGGHVSIAQPQSRGKVYLPQAVKISSTITAGGIMR